MTVSELIKALQAIGSQDAEVSIAVSEHYLVDESVLVIIEDDSNPDKATEIKL